MAKQRKSNRYYTGMLAYTETPKTMRRRRIYSKKNKQCYNLMIKTHVNNA